VKTLGTYFNFHHNFLQSRVGSWHERPFGIEHFFANLGDKNAENRFSEKSNSPALGCAEMLGSCGSNCTNGKSLRTIETNP